MRLIQQFHTKQITKARALVLLTSKLSFNPSKDEPEKYNVLNQYISTIDATELIVTKSTEQGSHTVTGFINTGKQCSDNRANVNPEEEMINRPTNRRDKRKRDAPESDDEDTDGEDIRTGDDSNRKHRVFEKVIPWYQQEAMMKSQLVSNSSYRQACTL